MKRYYISPLWVIFVLLMIAGLAATACGSTTAQGVRTWLLVTAPEGSLPLNKPLAVKSRTRDAEHFVSHVELHVVQLPSGPTDILIRSDAAPFQQTSFTASQVFIPTEEGHYVIKVVGYNKRGEKAESDHLGFDVEEVEAVP